MKTKPILSNGDMVNALLDGRKTQTRRPINNQPELTDGVWRWKTGKNSYMRIPESPEVTCLSKPKYQVGDVLWVRERARLHNYTWGDNGRYDEVCFDYEADNALSEWVEFPERLKPIKIGHCVPNGCFKELARIFLKVTGVKAERFCDISEADAIAEGLLVSCGDVHPGLTEYSCGDGFWTTKPIVAFHRLIELIYPGCWEHWCLAYGLERIEKCGS